MVKWRNLSYLHCTWESEEDLMNLEGSRMKQKLTVSICNIPLSFLIFIIPIELILSVFFEMNLISSLT